MDVVIISAPLFALVLLGYLATRVRLLPISALPGLNAYVLYFAITAMLFRLGAQTTMSELLNPWLMAAWLLGTWTCLALAIIPGLRGGLSWRDASFGGLAASSPNMGFMGIPLLIALLGADSLGPLMPVFIVDIVAIQSTVIALAQRRNGTGGSAWVKAGITLRRVLENPLLWAIVLGAAWGATGWVMPGPVDETIRLLGDSATPVALFTIGAVLAREQVTAAGAAQRSSALYVGWLTLLKLLALPALMWLTGQSAILLGAPIGAEEVAVLVLVAALPTAANTSILAERIGADNAIVASVILTSTAARFITFNAIAALIA